MRAGSATVRPTEGAGGTLGSLGGFSVTNNTQLGLTFTYMATDNIGVELLAATPFRHKIGTRATGDIATVHHLPPTLMAQWYFGDASSKFRPYVGAGINYTTFFDNGFNDHGKEAGLSDLSLKDSWGAAGQVGVDYLINRDWLVNMSVWYMDIDTTAKYKSGVTTVKTRYDWIRGCLCSPQDIVFNFLCKTSAKPLCKTGHQMTSFFPFLTACVVVNIGHFLIRMAQQNFGINPLLSEQSL